MERNKNRVNGPMILGIRLHYNQVRLYACDISPICKGAKSKFVCVRGKISQGTPAGWSESRGLLLHRKSGV